MTPAFGYSAPHPGAGGTLHLPEQCVEGQETPSEVMAAAFAAGYSTPGGYASGVSLGIYKFGAANFMVNSFRPGTHAAADLLLLNLNRVLHPLTQGPVLQLPAGFGELLQGIRNTAGSVQRSNNLATALFPFNSRNKRLTTAIAPVFH
jgi:hypothetical protein